MDRLTIGYLSWNKIRNIDYCLMQELLLPYFWIRSKVLGLQKIMDLLKIWFIHLVNNLRHAKLKNCCCFQRNPGNFHVRVGSIIVYNGSAYLVDQIFVHDKYVSPRIYHDIAIVRCKPRIVFTDEVSPICLPRTDWINKKKLIGKTAFLSGFGDLAFGCAQASALQQTDLKILNNSFCEENYHNLIDNRIRFPVGMKRSLISTGHEQGGKDACMVSSKISMGILL